MSMYGVFSQSPASSMGGQCSSKTTDLYNKYEDFDVLSVITLIFQEQRLHDQHFIWT